MSAGFYCSKHRGDGTKKLGSSVGSYLSTINLGESFSLSEHSAGPQQVQHGIGAGESSGRFKALPLPFYQLLITRVSQINAQLHSTVQQ
jgi:hypothetical protein